MTTKKTTGSTKTGPKKTASAKPGKANIKIVGDSDTTISDSVKNADPQPADKDEQLKKQELLSEIVERTGLKRNVAKTVLEATMEILGENIRARREMNLQPLGKVKFKRHSEDDKAYKFITQIRQMKPKTGDET